MPEPNQAPNAVPTPNPAQENAWDPPAGDLNLDDLFPNPELAEQQPAPATQPPPPAAPEYFLKASTGTVYKSHEDAVRGTEEKDRTIERLKGQIAANPQPTPPPPGQPDSDAFAKDIFKRLSDAASSGNEKAYLQTLAEFQMSQLAPFAPLLTEVAKEKAIRAMEPEAQDFRKFVGSAEYERTLEQFPLLKDAIRVAEQDPYRSGQLPEFYRLVYRSYTGEHAGERQAREIATNVPAPPPSRPTLTSSTPTLPATGIPAQSLRMTRDQVLQDRNARKEFLKRFEAENSGALNTSWSQVGL